jgi:patatin-like phospholipase/acyl hydrolase
LRILSVDGGGYLGLATASFLHAVEHRFGAQCSERFDLFCGTSTGAIIALALAAGRSAAEVASLYEDLGAKVFPQPSWFTRMVPQKWRGIRRTRHGDAPLQEALKDVFGDLTLGDLRARNKHVLITTFNLTSGRPKIFKTDHAEELTAHDGYLVRDIARASAAAPTYLPIVTLKDPITGAVERFCDGGLVANSPALLGYAEAVSHLRQRPEQIALLSLATPRADLAERTSSLTEAKRASDRGYARWGMGERIIALTMDGATMIADTALERIGCAAGARYLRVHFRQPEGVGLDVVTPEATETLQQLGVERANESALLRDLTSFFRDARCTHG